MGEGFRQLARWGAAHFNRLGIRQHSYDYRDAQIPTFEQELDALERHRIKLTAC